MIQIKNLQFSYAEKSALRGISFEVQQGKIFGLLGPNGSGKTTLFRILSTLILPSEGNVTICGFDIAKQVGEVREKIGIVFQSPSIDLKLTVKENILHQGHLYGLSGAELHVRAEELMKRLGIFERKNEIVAKLSGGLKRRVELAKGLLHKPTLLILDEPSTGLDPGARIELWNYLKQLRDQEKMTILVTTHLMEEAEHCDMLVILSEGNIVGQGTPEALKSEIGNGVIVVKAAKLQELYESIQQKFQIQGKVLEEEIQIEHPEGAKLVTKILEAFPGRIESVTFRRPTLEDVFIHKTGHKFFWEEIASSARKPPRNDVIASAAKQSK